MIHKEKAKAIAEKVMGWKYHFTDIYWEDKDGNCHPIFTWNPFANDADALMVLMHFPQWSACADETDTWVGFYCTAEEGFSVEHGFKVMARDEPDPAQRLRTCICEAALKACEVART